MEKIHIIKKNRKAHYMLIATLLSAFLLTLYGLLMLFSPLINYFDEANQITIYTGLRNFYTRELLPEETIEGLGVVVWKLIKFIKADWSFIAYNQELGSIVFLPSKFSIVWLPLIVGITGIFFIGLRWSLHTIGYNPKTKNGISKITKPIRSYSLTIWTCWLVLILIFGTTILTTMSASPFATGGFVTISLKGALTIDAGDMISSLNNVEEYLLSTGVHNKFFWLSMLLFNQKSIEETGITYIGSAVEQNSKMNKILWVSLPLLPLLLFTINNITGIIFGSCSWGSVNAHVVKALETQANVVPAVTQKEQVVVGKEDAIVVGEANVKATETVVVNDLGLPTDEDIQITTTSDLGPQKITEELKPRCVDFYKNVVNMFAKAKTIYSPIYAMAKQKLEDYESENDKKINWTNELKGIEDTMLKITGKDAKFVVLLQKILKHPRIELFGSDKPALEKLTKNYTTAYQKWDLVSVESAIEGIYLIAFNYEQLYGKIGFCIRTKLVNNYGSYVKLNNFVNRLEEAKNDADYLAYRNICIDSITAISSNKANFENSINKYIHN